MTTPLGYEFLRSEFKLPVLPVRRPAVVKPVTRIEHASEHVAVPQNVAPIGAAPLDHLQFALKHEGVNLSVIEQAVRLIEAAEMIKAVKALPNGVYVRKLSYLWELFRNERLEGLPEIGGPRVNLFDAAKYVVNPQPIRDTRWRVNWNGLGTPAYCATVERTEAVEQGIASDILGRAAEFASTVGKALFDRSLSWAYLSETVDSFAIEREAPSEDRAQAFVELLKQAHEQRKLSEDYFIELQNSTVNNPFGKAVQFRNEQNWLRGPLRGAAGVTYVPPPPELASELMTELMSMGNTLPRTIDPVVAASIMSFGFVFIHPFMDGNGRLSRFLFHHALCSSGRMADGLLLPVSVAMKRCEDEYLSTLQTFSKPARALWQVRWIDEGEYEFTFKGAPAIYRFWDATPSVEFGFKMATQALEHDLRRETEFLADYDTVFKTINGRFDVRGSDLSTLIVTCFDNDGTVSNHRRKQFGGRVPEMVFDAIQTEIAAVLRARQIREDDR